MINPGCITQRKELHLRTKTSLERGQTAHPIQPGNSAASRNPGIAFERLGGLLSLGFQSVPHRLGKARFIHLAPHACHDFALARSPAHPARAAQTSREPRIDGCWLFCIWFEVFGSSGMLHGFLQNIAREHGVHGPLSVFKGSATATIAVVRPFPPKPILPARQAIVCTNLTTSLRMFKVCCCLPASMPSFGQLCCPEPKKTGSRYSSRACLFK